MATTYHAYPVPQGTSAPFVHLDIKALADAVDKDIPVVVNDWAALQATPTLLNLKALLKTQNYRMFVNDGVTWKPARGGVKHVFTDNNIMLGPGTGLNAKISSGELELIHMTGSFVVQTDASGFFAITYPAAFPSGILNTMLSIGDSSTGRSDNYSAAGVPFTQSLSVFYGSVTDGNGAARANTNFRINLDVWGW